MYLAYIPFSGAQDLSIQRKRHFPSLIAGEDPDTALKIYLRNSGQIRWLTPQAEVFIWPRGRASRRATEKARALIIKRNPRLVVKIAHELPTLGLPLFGFKYRKAISD